MGVGGGVDTMSRMTIYTVLCTAVDLSWESNLSRRAGTFWVKYLVPDLPRSSLLVESHIQILGIQVVMDLTCMYRARARAHESCMVPDRISTKYESSLDLD